MAAVNNRRVLLGALLGGVVWNLWSMLLYFAVLSQKYEFGQQAGWFLKEPRYGFFPVVWILSGFLIAYGAAWLYASARATRGAGPKTALIIGVIVGFAAGFPMNFAMTTWSPMNRTYPFWWTLEQWGGAILAALVAGWIYKD